MILYLRNNISTPTASINTSSFMRQKNVDDNKQHKKIKSIKLKSNPWNAHLK